MREKQEPNREDKCASEEKMDRYVRRGRGKWGRGGRNDKGGGEGEGQGRRLRGGEGRKGGKGGGEGEGGEGVGGG